MDFIVSLQWLLREQETDPMFRNGFYYHNECDRNYYHHHSLIQEAIKIEIYQIEIYHNISLEEQSYYFLYQT